MKSIILFLLVMFISCNVFAAEESDKKIQNVKRNITYSPISYNNFTNSIAAIDNDYGLKEQLYEIPIKRIGLDILFPVNLVYPINRNLYLGYVLMFSHNRVNTGVNPFDGIEYERKKTSITNITVGFTSMEAVNFISKQLYFKLTIGLSDLSIWRKEIDDEESIAGLYLDIGFRYIFPSDSLYNINLGIDFSFADSFLSAGQGNYRAIGMLGAYPYIGYMW